MLAYISKFINNASVNRCVCCEDYIGWREAFCVKCYQTLPFYIGDDELLLIDQVICAFFYRFPLDNLISKFKFLRCYNIGRALCAILYNKVSRSAIKPQAIIYVPLHKKKLYQRKFNQAHFIAKFLAHRLSIPLLENHVVKIKVTQQQHKSDKQQRQKNLRQAFKLNKKINYQHVAIVDDVITTGATVQEIARILKQQSGVKLVEVWGLARVEVN